jgi:predicted naringenin-chalcone synthase
MTTRRRFVVSALGAAGAAAGPAAAHAFRVVEPDAELRAAYAEACSSRFYHQDLVAEVVRQFSDQGRAVASEEVRAALAAKTCPWCGCSVALRAPDRPDDPR